MGCDFTSDVSKLAFGGKTRSGPDLEKFPAKSSIGWDGLPRAIASVIVKGGFPVPSHIVSMGKGYEMLVCGIKNLPEGEADEQALAHSISSLRHLF